MDLYNKVSVSGLCDKADLYANFIRPDVIVNRRVAPKVRSSFILILMTLCALMVFLLHFFDLREELCVGNDRRFLIVSSTRQSDFV